MAVTSVTELWDGRTGSVDFAGVRTYSKVFQVLTDTILDAREVMTASAGGSTIPVLGEAFSANDLLAKAIKIQPDQEPETPYVWAVRVDYSSDTGSSSSPLDEDPLARPQVEEWTFNKWTEPAKEDRDGDPIRNAAGEQFDVPDRKSVV